MPAPSSLRTAEAAAANPPLISGSLCGKSGALHSLHLGCLALCTPIPMKAHAQPPRSAKTVPLHGAWLGARRASQRCAQAVASVLSPSAAFAARLSITSFTAACTDRNMAGWKKPVGQRPTRLCCAWRAGHACKETERALFAARQGGGAEARPRRGNWERGQCVQARLDGVLCKHRAVELHGREAEVLSDVAVLDGQLRWRAWDLAQERAR